MKITPALGLLSVGISSATIENDGRYLDAMVRIKLRDAPDKPVKIELIDCDNPERTVFAQMMFPGTLETAVFNVGTLFGGVLPKRWAIQASARAEIAVDVVTMEAKNDELTYRSRRFT